MKILAFVIVATALAFLKARSGEYWICGKCGAKNNVYTSIYKECGASR